MYGTVARLHVKPGMRDGLLGWAREIGQVRTMPGHVRSIVYQMDADPDALILAVFFESREAYHANAASPEQHAEYLKMMQFLAEEPIWQDGEIVWHADADRLKNIGGSQS